MTESKGNVFDGLSEEIRKVTRRKLDLFDSLRGKDVRQLQMAFWDMVVVTSVDEEQRLAYEQQIESKVVRGELPTGVIYEVVSDPPGEKIGNGGGTLNAIEKLENIHGRSFLHQCKILLLNAGGFSQRLPSASVLGKIFTAVPLGDPVYQMLEVKLALCVEFPQRMKPGVFVSCPDIMEVFTIDDGHWSFEQPGITAIAHPSPIEIGTTHGVFILAEKPHVNMVDVPSVTCATCIEFLHKPSKQRMHEKNAVFTMHNEEYVYTDSEFFMDWATVTKLLVLYKEVSPLGCEIDAYGDFLQGLGLEGTADYCKNVANVVEVAPNLVETRERFYHCLRGTQFNVLLFNKSKFYHIGSMKEYTTAFCDDLVFRYEMCLQNRTFVHFNCEEKMALNQPESTCILHSFIANPVNLGQQCVIEYSTLEDSVTIGDGCIISNMLVPSGTTIPPCYFFHTVCVKIGRVCGLYVTVLFHTNDNVKKVKPESQMHKLKYCGQSLDKALIYLRLRKEELWPNDTILTNLWHARLFPVFECRKSSSAYAVKMSQALTTGEVIKNGDCKFYGNGLRLSMADIVKMKDIKNTLNIREILRNKLLTAMKIQC